MQVPLKAIANLKNLERQENLEATLRSEQDDYKNLEPIFNQERGVCFWPDDVGNLGGLETEKDHQQDKQVETGGSHVLAWYEPFHPFSYGMTNRWGIFIRASAVENVARKLVRGGLPPTRAVNDAMRLLHGHEFGHFQYEMIAANAEIATSSVSYLEDVVALKAQSPNYSFSGEGLCNKLALEALGSPGDKILKSWLSTFPSGYRDWQGHTVRSRPASWARVLEEHRTALATLFPSSLATLGAKSLAHPFEINGLTKPQLAELALQVPVYLVPDGSGPNGRVAGYLQGALVPHETPEFLKDLRSTGDFKKMKSAWEKTKNYMAQGFLSGSIHLEKLDGLTQATYSVRVEGNGVKGARAALVRENASWYAVAIDRDHDTLYNRIRRQSPFTPSN